MNIRQRFLRPAVAKAPITSFDQKADITDWYPSRPATVRRALVRELLERRSVAAECSETVAAERHPEKPGDTAKLKTQQLKS
jgi:hypothetical protein